MKFFVAGGAGFIGNHLVRRLLSRPNTQVVVYDNFSSGRMWHLEDWAVSPQLQIARGDVKDLQHLKESMAGCGLVFHLGSNPDIANAFSQPDIRIYKTLTPDEFVRMSGGPLAVIGCPRL